MQQQHSLYFIPLSPVFQTFVSLIKSLVKDSLNLLVHIKLISYKFLLYTKNMVAFAVHCKSCSLFFNKKPTFFFFFFFFFLCTVKLNIKGFFTDDVISAKQQGPEN